MSSVILSVAHGSWHFQTLACQNFFLTSVPYPSRKQVLGLRLRVANRRGQGKYGLFQKEMSCWDKQDKGSGCRLEKRGLEEEDSEENL
jgi:hypothetical protein